jgi:hypothetical protein
MRLAAVDTEEVTKAHLHEEAARLRAIVFAGLEEGNGPSARKQVEDGGQK